MYSESELLTAIDSGIQTVIPQAAIVTPQSVYLDFDGANTSYYNRELGIEIGGVAVEDSGFDSATISVIVASINEQFGDDVLFTSELPSEGYFSTIYIGVTSAFDEYGSFYGIAETIDSGNQIHDDNAFVLLDSSASVELVVSVIAHETEHIVSGYDHGGEGLDRYASATYIVNYGEVSSDIVVGNSDSMDVYNQGEAIDTNVSGGIMNVSSGGTAISTTIQYGVWYPPSEYGDFSSGVSRAGEMHLLPFAMAESTTLSGGTMLVDSHATANSTTIYGGTMYVSSSGKVNSTTVSGGTMIVDGRASATFTTVTSGGSLVVLNNGIVTIEFCPWGNGSIDSSGHARITYIDHPAVYYGNEEIGVISQANVINAATISSGISMMVYDGGSTSRVHLNNGGVMFVSGGVASKTTVEGNMFVVSGGTAHTPTVSSGGSLLVANGGSALKPQIFVDGTMIVSSGALAQKADIHANATVIVSSGGSASSTDVMGYGKMIVSDGGTAKGISVKTNGKLFVSSGGTAKGTIRFEDGVTVSACSGAVIDFTVAELENNNTTLINRYNYIEGAQNASYTLTVAENQPLANYVLAWSASSFNSTITVNYLPENGGSFEIGTLSVGESLIYGNSQYVLLLDDETLRFNVSFFSYYYLVTDPDVEVDNSFDVAYVSEKTLVKFDSTKAVFNYSDGMTATYSMEIVGNGTSATTLSGGEFYLACNETSFSDITLDGKVFGGIRMSDDSKECDSTSLSFNGVGFTDRARVFGGADLSGTALLVINSITISMEEVDGGNARVFGAGRVAGNANLIVGNIDVTISCADSGSFGNYFAGAEALSGFAGIIACGTVSTVIDGGEFIYCGNGSQLRGGTSAQGTSTLTINGGTFNYFVYAGAFSANDKANATVDGDSTLMINGGTFKSHVFGGCGANNSTNGANTLVEGDVFVTIDTSNKSVSFEGNIYAGSIGTGSIMGSTTMTFTGLGENLSFATNSYVTGGSQMSKNMPECIEGTATLAFDGFSGAFAANVNNGFTNVAISGSNVSFTGQKVYMRAVSDWAIEVASEDAELTLANGKNSFEGDTLAITMADGAAPTTDGWSVIVGTNATLTGWDAFSSVSLDGKAAAYADGAWSTETYRLYRDGNALKLASIGSA